MFMCIIKVKEVEQKVIFDLKSVTRNVNFINAIFILTKLPKYLIESLIIQTLGRN